MRKLNELLRYRKRFVFSLTFALLTACSSTPESSSVPTLAVLPSVTRLPTTEACAIPTVQPTKEGPAIRAITTEELIDLLNSKIERSEDKIAVIIPLQEPVSIASLTLVGACVGGGCLPLEGIAGSGMINAIALTVGTAAELGYAAIPFAAYLAPVSMVLGNSVQGAIEGFYEFNPQNGQFEQVSAHQGQYDRAKAVIEFFRDSRGAQAVKFQGREIVRVATSTSNVSSAPLTKDQVEGKIDGMATENTQTLEFVGAELIPNDQAVKDWEKIEPMGGNGSGEKPPTKRDEICEKAYNALKQKFQKPGQTESEGIKINIHNEDPISLFGRNYDWGYVVDWMKLWCGDRIVRKMPTSNNDPTVIVRRTTSEENSIQIVKITSETSESDLSRFSSAEIAKWLRIMQWSENTRGEGYRLWQRIATYLSDRMFSTGE